MEYEKISTVLRRYSFDEKMRIANYYSRQTYTWNGLINPNQLIKLPLPWELETFTLLSIKAKEWQYNNFSGTDDRRFAEIINAIRNKKPSFLNSLRDEQLITWFIAVTAATQFDIQEFYPYKLYRYNYFFTFKNEQIDMHDIFRNKFGCDYYEYILLGWLLWRCFTDETFDQQLFLNIVKRFSIPVSHLSVLREQYVVELDTFAADPADYIYCLRPSYLYPFVEYEGRSYCPLPHLLIRATTSSLMHRLTSEDNTLRKTIGKEVYERYLYEIILESGIFDEVIPEQEYATRNGNRRTADVMVRVGNDYIFFDSKSFTPKASIRTFSEADLQLDISRLAKSIVQLYRHIKERFPDEYCCFREKPESTTYNIFGIVVVQEDAYIKSELVYKEAAQKLDIAIGSTEYEWLYSHVGIVPIYVIEKYCFTGTDPIPDLHNKIEEKRINDLWLTGKTRSEITNEKFLAFSTKLGEDTFQIMQPLCNS